MIFGSKYIVYIPWNLSKKTSSKSAQENLSKSAPNQLQIRSKSAPNILQIWSKKLNKTNLQMIPTIIFSNHPSNLSKSAL